MKIGSSDEIIKSTGFNVQKQTDAETGSNFGEILNSAMEQSPSSDGQTAAPCAVGGSAPVTLAQMTHTVQIPMVDRVEGFIDLMETYQQQLGDPQVSLKAMDPLVQQMTAETESLIADSRSLAETDDLKKIVDQTLITASSEIARFNRGDYIPVS